MTSNKRPNNGYFCKSFGSDNNYRLDGDLTMDRTLRIFLTIEESPDISQRRLAKKTGFSLGTVNGILQKLIDQEEVISNMSVPNHYIYELTHKGDLHKAKLLYDFTVDGYEVIGKIRTHTKRAIERSINEGINTFYLYGQEDSIYRLVRMSFIEVKRKSNITYVYINSFDEIIDELPYRIFVWNKENLVDVENTINILLSSSI